MIFRNLAQQKFQLTMKINFISSEDTNKKHVIHSKRDTIEVMSYDDLEKIVEGHLESLLSRYQIGLERQMRDSNHIFDCVNLLYFKCHKKSFKCSGLYIDIPDWIKRKK